MKEWFFRLRILRVLLNEAIREWRKDVAQLDEQMCCGGQDCGCMGSTFRHQWECELRGRKTNG